MSLKDHITKVVYNSNDWVSGATIERFSMENGYKASNASRRARELANEYIFERRIRNGSVEYRCEVLPIHLRDLSSEEVLKYSTM